MLSGNATGSPAFVSDGAIVETAPLLPKSMSLITDPPLLRKFSAPSGSSRPARQRTSSGVEALQGVALASSASRTAAWIGTIAAGRLNAEQQCGACRRRRLSRSWCRFWCRFRRPGWRPGCPCRERGCLARDTARPSCCSGADCPFSSMAPTDRTELSAAGRCRQAHPSLPAAATTSTFRSSQRLIAASSRGSGLPVDVNWPPLMLRMFAPASTACRIARARSICEHIMSSPSGPVPKIGTINPRQSGTMPAMSPRPNMMLATCVPCRAARAIVRRGRHKRFDNAEVARRRAPGVTGRLDRRGSPDRPADRRAWSAAASSGPDRDDATAFADGRAERHRLWYLRLQPIEYIYGSGLQVVISISSRIGCVADEKKSRAEARLSRCG